MVALQICKPLPIVCYNILCFCPVVIQFLGKTQIIYWHKYFCTKGVIVIDKNHSDLFLYFQHCPSVCNMGTAHFTVIICASNFPFLASYLFRTCTTVIHVSCPLIVVSLKTTAEAIMHNLK